ncbi:MAG: 50S ribosomal protein L15 [Actinomycetota bacterium]
MKLHHLRPAPGAKKAPKRVGRGEGSGHGKTSGRGMKGSKARGEVRAGFEGGQMPLQRRVPKLKGFTNPFKVEYDLVNVERLGVFSAGSVVGPQELVDRGVVRKGRLVKVLGGGELSVALTVKAHAFSGTASEKVRSAGGTVEIMKA